MNGYFVGYQDDSAIGGPNIVMCCPLTGDSRVFATIAEAEDALAHFRSGKHLRDVPGGGAWLGPVEYAVYRIEKIASGARP